MAKLLFICHFGNIGGAGISLTRTALMAKESGFDVKICVPEGSLMEKKCSEEGFDTVAFKSKPGSIEYYSGGPGLYRRTYFKMALRRPRFAAEILNIAKTEKPDAVIVNSITQSFLVPRLLKEGFKTGIFVRETFPENGSKAMLARYRKLLSAANGVYFISDHDRNFFNISGTRAVTVRNSVSDGFFEPFSRAEACEKLGIGDSGLFRVLYVGGDSVIKGAEIIAEVSSMLPGNVELLACGADPAILDRLFEGASCSVLKLGFCNDMRCAYRACDALVLPIVKPHQARPVFEAGAAGKPVIAPDFPELREYVKNGENGITVKPGDGDGDGDAYAKDIAEAIVRLRDCGEAARDSLGEKNRELALKNHTTAAVRETVKQEFSLLTGG